MLKDKRPKTIKGKAPAKPKKSNGNTPKLKKNETGRESAVSPSSFRVDAETEMGEAKQVDSEAQHEPLQNVNRSVQLEILQTVDVEMQTLREDEVMSESIPALFRTNHALLDLDDEIRSRKRTLELLNLKLPDFNEEIKEQLKIRDIRIDVLHNQNVSLRALIKEKNQAISGSKLRAALKANEEELTASKNAQLALEQRLLSESQKFASKQLELENELETTVSLNEALSEEIEGLKAQVKIKGKQSIDYKNDMKKLSEIIGDMSGVNSQLNIKIEQLNLDMSSLAQKYHEASVKAEHVEEVEALLAALSSEASDNRHKADKLEKTVEGLKRISYELEMASRTVCAKLGDISNSVAEIGTSIGTNDAGKHQTLKGIALNLSELQRLLQSKTPDEGTTDEKANQIEEFATKLSELECVIKAKDSLILKLTAQEQDLKKLYDGVTEENARATKTWNEISEKSKKQLAELHQRLDHFVTSLNTAREDIGKLTVEHTRTTSALESITNSSEELKHKLVEARGQLNNLENRLRKAYSDFKENQELAKSKEEALKAVEIKASRVLNGFGILQEEIFKRENEYLSRERTILQLENQIEESKQRYSALQASVKKIVARELESSNTMLDQKDREISLLKEMIRSSHVEIKGKDNTIQKYKVKYKEQSPTGNSKIMSRRNFDSPKLESPP